MQAIVIVSLRSEVGNGLFHGKEFQSMKFFVVSPHRMTVWKCIVMLTETKHLIHAIAHEQTR